MPPGAQSGLSELPEPYDGWLDGAELADDADESDEPLLAGESLEPDEPDDVLLSLDACESLDPDDSLDADGAELTDDSELTLLPLSPLLTLLLGSDDALLTELGDGSLLPDDGLEPLETLDPDETELPLLPLETLEPEETELPLLPELPLDPDDSLLPLLPLETLDPDSRL